MTPAEPMAQVAGPAPKPALLRPAAANSPRSRSPNQNRNTDTARRSRVARRDAPDGSERNHHQQRRESPFQANPFQVNQRLYRIGLSPYLRRESAIGLAISRAQWREWREQA